MKTKSNIPKTFFLFLIAASFIWLLITFSKEYTSTINYAVNYKNIPQNKLLQETPVKSINVAVKGSGFKILSSKIKQQELSLDATKLYRKKNSSYYLLTNNQLGNLQSQLKSGLQLLKVDKDTIFLSLGSLVTKKVPVKAKLDIAFHVGYDLIDSVAVKPDSVVISGPEKLIDSIQKIDVKKISLTDVKDNFTEEVFLKNEKNIKYSDNKITISGKVDKFTEGTLQVPFAIKNVPENVSLTTLTETVDIKFVVVLSNFGKIDENSFKIECDYAKVQKENMSYLIPELVAKPKEIKSYKIIPKKIDFLIRK